jgi:DNA-binding NarL/FixJ family response regulator
MNEIRELHPDIVILDIQLHGKSGIELLRDIRSAGIKTHVIILTNFAYPQYQKECLEAGAEFFLSKVKEFDLLPSILNSFDPAAEKGRNLQDVPDGLAGSNEDRPP